ncbi:MAG TPA: hypothetical protein VF091_10185 [Gaiellaceae bacterium]
MTEGISIRTLVVGSDTHVVVLSGSLDEAAAPAVGAALQRGDGHRTIVDLLDVTDIDRTGASLLDRPNVVVVADQPVLRALSAATDHQPRVYERLTDAIADAVGV